MYHHLHCILLCSSPSHLLSFPSSEWAVQSEEHFNSRRVFWSCCTRVQGMGRPLSAGPGSQIFAGSGRSHKSDEIVWPQHTAAAWWAHAPMVVEVLLDHYLSWRCVFRAAWLHAFYSAHFQLFVMCPLSPNTHACSSLWAVPEEAVDSWRHQLDEKEVVHPW